MAAVMAWPVAVVMYMVPHTTNQIMNMPTVAVTKPYANRIHPLLLAVSTVIHPNMVAKMVASVVKMMAIAVILVSFCRSLLCCFHCSRWWCGLSSRRVAGVSRPVWVVVWGWLCSRCPCPPLSSCRPRRRWFPWLSVVPVAVVGVWWRSACGRVGVGLFPWWWCGGAGGVIGYCGGGSRRVVGLRVVWFSRFRPWGRVSGWCLMVSWLRGGSRGGFLGRLARGCVAVSAVVACVGAGVLPASAASGDVALSSVGSARIESMMSRTSPARPFNGVDADGRTVSGGVDAYWQNTSADVVLSVTFPDMDRLRVGSRVLVPRGVTSGSYYGWGMVLPDVVRSDSGADVFSVSDDGSNVVLTVLPAVSSLTGRGVFRLSCVYQVWTDAAVDRVRFESRSTGLSFGGSVRRFTNGAPDLSSVRTDNNVAIYSAGSGPGVAYAQAVLNAHTWSRRVLWRGEVPSRVAEFNVPRVLWRRFDPVGGSVASVSFQDYASSDVSLAGRGTPERESMWSWAGYPALPYGVVRLRDVSDRVSVSDLAGPDEAARVLAPGEQAFKRTPDGSWVWAVSAGPYFGGPGFDARLSTWDSGTNALLKRSRDAGLAIPSFDTRATVRFTHPEVVQRVKVTTRMNAAMRDLGFADSSREYESTPLDSGGGASAAAFLDYDGNGGSGVPGPSRVAAGSRVVAASSSGVSRPWFVFSGWNTLPDGSGSAVAPGGVVTVPEGGLRLYAMWRPVRNVVRFAPGGGSGSMADVPMSGSVGVAAPRSGFSRAGFVFDGWDAVWPDGSSRALAVGDVVSPVDVDGAVVTLTARWRPVVSSLPAAGGRVSPWPVVAGVVAVAVVAVAGSVLSRRRRP